MLRRVVSLSPVILDMAHGPYRRPPRPFSLRHADYEDNFDFTTLFYDCFWNAAGTAIEMVGPPRLNLVEDAPLAITALPSRTECAPRSLGGMWSNRRIVDVPAGTSALLIRIGDTEYTVAPQPNLCHLFEGRRAVTTLSKDNHPAWIRDWVQFNRDYHGCTGALLYDNGSTEVATAAVYDAVASLGGDVTFVIVDWPFRYGLNDARQALSYRISETLYSQNGGFEHARRRFLASARSVLNTDIDELVVTENDTSIFDLVEAAPTGYVQFGGKWIENYSDLPRLAGVQRHRDFSHFNASRAHGCQRKWAVVPARIPEAAQWHTHGVMGAAPSDLDVWTSLGHFKGINTNWSLDRARSSDLRTASQTSANPDELQEDLHLRAVLDRVFANEPLPLPAPVEPERAANLARLASARFDEAGRLDSAIAEARRAVGLLPAHAGLHLHLAGLLRRAGDSEAAERAEADAAALREADPFVHLQRGRWLMDEGHFDEAQQCFRQGIALDPAFPFNHHLLAQMESIREQPDAEATTVRDLAEHLPDHPGTHVRQAHVLAGQHRMAEAVHHLEQAANLAPTAAGLHLQIARLYRTMRNFDASEAAIQRAVALHCMAERMNEVEAVSAESTYPMDVEWAMPLASNHAFELARTRLERGDLDGALAAGLAARTEHVGKAELALLLASIRAGQGDEAEAARLRAEALAAARLVAHEPPNDSAGIVGQRGLELQHIATLARALTANALDAEAIALLEDGLRRLSGSLALVTPLVEIHLRRGDDGAAKRVLEDAMSRRPDQAILPHLMSTLVAPGDLTDALRLSRRAAELAPLDPVIALNLARLLQTAGDVAGAEAVIRQALDRGGRSASLYRELSQLHEGRGEIDEAVAAARAAVALSPDAAAVQRHHVTLLRRAGPVEAFSAALDDALRHLPRDPELQSWRAELLASQGKADAALAAMEKAVADDRQGRPWIRMRFAYLLERLGYDREAEAVLREAVESGIESAPIWLRLSQFDAERGDTVGALAAARRAHELAPDRPEIAAACADLLARSGDTEAAKQMRGRDGKPEAAPRR